MKPLFAVAVNTFKETVRSRWGWPLFTAFILINALIPLIIVDDGTLKGKVQITLNYNYIWAHLVLILLAGQASVNSLRSDVETGSFLLIKTKPISDISLLAGKWLGLMISLSLVLFISALISLLPIWLWFDKASDQEAQLVKEEILVRRHEFPLPGIIQAGDIEALVQEDIKELKRKGEWNDQVDEDREAIRIREEVTKWSRSLGPNLPVEFSLKGLNVESQTPIYIRYRFHVVGRSEFESVPLKLVWLFKDQKTKQPIVLPSQTQSGSYHEIRIPIEAVTASGELEMGLLHRQPIVLMWSEDELTVLQAGGTFFLNYFQVYLVMFCSISFISCLGLFLASFFSTPISYTLIGSCLILFLFVGPLVLGISDEKTSELVELVAERDFSFYLRQQAEDISKSLASLISLKPIDYLNTGRALPYDLIFRAIVLALLGVIPLALGAWANRRRAPLDLVE